MLRFPRFLVLCFLITVDCGAMLAIADEIFPLAPETNRREGVPQGKVTEHKFDTSQVFEGTQRRYSIYVPAQYDGSQPAALMVFQDGHSFDNLHAKYRVPIVFDNLIASGDMPVTIAVMVDPGNKGPLPEKRGWNQGTNNRSVEYDSVSDNYAKFLIDELLPEVAKSYKITDNPELRAICGDSSGGICAFSVAWHRPDSFRKVLSHIGSFVDLRGGHNYPPMIRKQEKRPIRVFLYECEDDLDNEFGNWPLANREMAAALKYRDYDYKFVMGKGVHVNNDSGKYFADELRWLWSDWKRQTP
jgi:enterochelin esterase-like enzyme